MRVRLPRDVGHVADERHEAGGEVDQGVQHHPDEDDARHAQAVRVVENGDRERRGGDVADARE